MRKIRIILVCFLIFILSSCSEVPAPFWSAKTTQDYLERQNGLFKSSNCVKRENLRNLPELLSERIISCLLVGNILRLSKKGDKYFENWKTFFFIKKNGYINEYDRNRKLVSSEKYYIKTGFLCTKNQCFKVLLDKSGWLGVKSADFTYTVTRGDTTFYRLY